MASKNNDVQIKVQGLRDRKAEQAIIKGLVAFNRATAGRWPRGSITATATGKGGKLQGGLVGYISWGWLFVNVFWLDEQARGRGAGARCIAAAEAEAERRGCHGVWLNTASFQAPDFYRKQGYKQLTRLAGYPPGHDYFWFYKKLKPAKPMAGSFPRPSGRPRPPRRQAVKNRRA